MIRALRLTFAHAVVRKLALVLVAAFLAWCGIAKAHAATAGADGCISNSDGCNREQAYNSATALADREGDRICKLTGGQTVSYTGANIAVSAIYQSGFTGTYLAGITCSNGSNTANAGERFWYAACPTGTIWSDASNTCAADCTQKTAITNNFTPPNGSVACSEDGCDVASFYNGDGTSTHIPTGQSCDVPPTDPDCSRLGPSYYWHATLFICVPKDPPDCEPGQTPKEGVCEKPDSCPAGMVADHNGLCKPKDNECPAGQIKSPEGLCLPGEGQCAAGEVRGEDGTCKKDGNGDGEADPDDPNNKSFSGGDDCNAPPSCSGDPIMCGQARIQWRIDCNTRKNVTVSGGSCDAVPVCTGEKCDALEYSQLLQQWRATCALQKLVSQSDDPSGSEPSDLNGNGIPDEMEQGIAETPGTAPVLGQSPDLWSQVNKNGWLGGSSCPGLPSFTIAGSTVDLGAKPCEQGAYLGWAIYAFFLTASAFVIGRAASGA